MVRVRPRPASPVPGIVGAAAVVAMVSACSSGTAPADAAAAATSSVQAALSSAAQASPGEYGTPVDPSLPNPTSVAVDSPVPTPAGATAPVVLTFADWEPSTASIEAGAYVAGVVESGGTCTITASRNGAAPVSASVTAEPDAGSTSCPALALPGDGLSAGSWTVQVAYRSSTAEGTSDDMTVVVP